MRSSSGTTSELPVVDALLDVVVGVPHLSMENVLAAFVVPRAGDDLEWAELLRFARSQSAGYKLPYSTQIVPELPLLSSGKPDRIALRERAVQDSPDGSA